MFGHLQAWRVAAGRGRIPLWLKLLFTAFLLVLVPTYWHGHGPANFLWGCDIALLMTLIALWRESALPNSMMAVGVLPFELGWIVDFVSGARLLGATSYMFDPELGLFLRALSLFHIAMPAIIIFLLARLGYDRRALIVQTLLTWVVLLATYLVTDPADNMNFVFGLGQAAQTALPPLVYLALVMIALPLLICLPMHLLLRRLVRRPGDGSPGKAAR